MLRRRVECGKVSELVGRREDEGLLARVGRECSGEVILVQGMEQNKGGSQARPRRTF